MTQPKILFLIEPTKVSHFRSHRLPGISVLSFHHSLNELPSTGDADMILLPLFIESDGYE